MRDRGIGSARAALVARWFGVTDNQVRGTTDDGTAPTPAIDIAGGRLILLTGASGSGKSTLLRRLRRGSNRSARWVDLNDVRLGQAAVIDAMAEAMGGEGDDETTIVAALEALSRVGLGEVWSYLRTPAELSEGQRWRLRLALALARVGRLVEGGGGFDEDDGGNKGTCGAPAKRGRGGGRRGDGVMGRWGEGARLVVIGADEFAAPLDRVTALVVSRALRKTVSGRRDLCAVVATARDDLEVALDPDLVVRCDFGAFTVCGRGVS